MSASPSPASSSSACCSSSRFRFPAISDLFVQRAQLVQDYDAEHLGRFQRHAIGFNMMLDHPLGIGAMEFGNMLGEDEHDIWLKTLTTYGWLGFAAYLTPGDLDAGRRLPAALPQRARCRRWCRSPTSSSSATSSSRTVIDIDHWRHVYLLFGLLWGAIAADRRATRTHLAARRSGQDAQAAPRLEMIS